MKIGIITDVHGRYDTLRLVLERLSTCGAIINLGDVADFSPKVNECYDLLKQKNIINCIGNHEQEVLSAAGEDDIVLLDAEGNERSQDFGVSEENKRFIRTWKTGLLINKDGLACHFAHGRKVKHGSTFTFEYLIEGNAAEHLAATNAQIAFCGHLHRGQAITDNGNGVFSVQEVESTTRIKLQSDVKYGFNVGMLSKGHTLNYAVLDTTEKQLDVVTSVPTLQ